MHNLHIVVVKAFSGEDAVEIVEQEIIEWGDSNNWKILCGAISEDGKVYLHEKGTWKPTTLEDLNSHIQSFYKTQSNIINNLKKELDWYAIMKFAQHMYELSQIEAITCFNVWEDSYLEYQYDRAGVTHLDNKGEGHLWAVYVDVHS